MYFKLEWIIREMYLKDKTLNFSFGGAHLINVVLRSPTMDEQKSGYDRGNAFCTATSQQESAPQIHAMFESLDQNRLPLGSGKPDKYDYIDQNGHIRENYVAPMELMPRPFQSFARQVRAELADHARRTVNVLRWRLGWKGPHNPVSSRGMKWSLDGQTWRAMPHAIMLYVDESRYGGVSDEVRSEIESMVKKGLTEPTGHELFREAWEQRHRNPRSALVIVIAAAEVGFKQCVSTIVPETLWLIENVPSPPLVKMLREYLPKLPVKCKIRGVVSPLPDVLLEALEDGVNLRNRAAHIGQMTFAYERLDEVLLVVRDLLWILDYYSGFNWALNDVRPDIRRLLES